MRIPIIAGNWKMNNTISQSVQLVEGLKALLEKRQVRIATLKEPSGVEVVVCPPFTALSLVGSIVNGSGIKLGAQDVFWKGEGAYTGNISPLMLRDVGCEYVIIGHSERRGRFGKRDEEIVGGDLALYFAETDASVNRKVLAALEYGLKPIICVGETLQERDAGQTDKIVGSQTLAALRGVDVGKEQVSSIVLAYEPVWAIGTGRACDAQEANRVIGLIRSVIADLYADEIASRMRIQYGGSVTPNNIEELMTQPQIDGALVGGASLKADAFATIVSAAQKRLV